MLLCAGARCQLGRQPWAYTFADAGLSAFSAALFASIVQGWAGKARQLGAPPPQLNRCGCRITDHVVLLQQQLMSYGNETGVGRHYSATAALTAGKDVAVS
jgi:hypothetical protein